MKTISKFLRDSLKLALFELGAGYYARKLIAGPETDLRREFIDSLALPLSNGNGRPFRVLDVGCGPGYVSQALAQRGLDVTGVDRSRRLLQIARKLASRRNIRLRLERSSSHNLPMSVTRMRQYAAESRLTSRDTGKLIAWATAASFNRRFEETELHQLLTFAGLVNVSFDRRMGGMVLFSKASVPLSFTLQDSYQCADGRLQAATP